VLLVWLPWQSTIEDPLFPISKSKVPFFESEERENRAREADPEQKTAVQYESSRPRIRDKYDFRVEISKLM